MKQLRVEQDRAQLFMRQRDQMEQDYARLQLQIEQQRARHIQDQSTLSNQMNQNNSQQVQTLNA